MKSILQERVKSSNFIIWFLYCTKENAKTHFSQFTNCFKLTLFLFFENNADQFLVGFITKVLTFKKSCCKKNFFFLNNVSSKVMATFRFVGAITQVFLFSYSKEFGKYIVFESNFAFCCRRCLREKKKKAGIFYSFFHFFLR